MKTLSVGDTLQIVGSKSNHGFKIGTNVKITTNIRELPTQVFGYTDRPCVRFIHCEDVRLVRRVSDNSAANTIIKCLTDKGTAMTSGELEYYTKLPAKTIRNTLAKLTKHYELFKSNYRMLCSSTMKQGSRYGLCKK